LLAVSAFIWVKYHEFSNDLVASNLHVPKRVKSALSPDPGSAGGPTVILVEGVSHVYKRPQGATILIRLDPSKHLASTLTVPPTARVSPSITVGTALDNGGTAALIHDLNATTSVRVSHVMLLNRTQLGHVVDTLGGITFHNPAPTTFPIGSGTYRLPAGNVALNGTQAGAFLRANPTPIGQSPAQRQQLVLRALTEKLVDLNSLSAVERLGRVVASSVATDLTPSQVVSLVSSRLDISRITRCTVAASRLLGGHGTRSTLAGFRGARPPAGRAASQCSSQPISSPVHGPLASGLKLVARHFSAVVQWLLIIVAALWTLTLLALLWTSRRTRGVFGGRVRAFPQVAIASGPAEARPERSTAKMVVESPSPRRKRHFGTRPFRREEPAPTAAVAPRVRGTPSPTAETPTTTSAPTHPAPVTDTPSPSPSVKAETPAATRCVPDVPPPKPSPEARTSPAPTTRDTPPPPAPKTETPAATRPVPDPPTSSPKAQAPAATPSAPDGGPSPSPSSKAETGAATPDTMTTPGSPSPKPKKPAAPVPTIPAPSLSERMHQARLRAHCAVHGHDSRPHRPGPNSQIVHLCLHCGQPVPPPEPASPPGNKTPPAKG